MGKGARLRAERREKQAVQVSVEALLEAVAEIDSADDLALLTQERPELFAPDVLDHIETAHGLPHAAPYLEPITQLVRLAPEDPQRAWRAYSEVLLAIEGALRATEPESEELAARLEEGRYDEAVEVGESLLARALDAGLGLVVAETHERLATAYRFAEDGDKAENLDRAIDHAEGVVAATPEPSRAGAMMNLAVLIDMRVKGDPAENFEHGVALLREALEEANRGGDPKVKATIEMNLARTLQVRQRGDKLENLLEARDLCFRSLQYRSLDLDPVDWAHSQLNLGGIQNDLIPLGGASIEDAEAPLRKVIDAVDQIREKWLIGFAYSSLGAVHRDEAGRIQRATDRVSIGPNRADPPEGEEARELGLAQEHFERGLELLDPTRNRDTVGRTLADLAGVADCFEDDDDAIARYRVAVEHIDPRLEPRLARDAGGRLGSLLASRGEWSDSVASFAMALEGAELAFHARLDTSDRIGEGQQAGNLSRWAAFAMARNGELEKALLVLENGKTRELRRRLGVGVVEDQLDLLPAEARHDYEAGLANLAATPFGADSHEAARVFQQILTAIRNIPGHQNFGTGVALSHISDAIEDGWPLLYVNPSPYGTMLLAAYLGADGEVQLKAQFLDNPTSFDVYMQMMLGNYGTLLPHGESNGPPTAYLAALSDPQADPDHLDRALVYLTRSLGDSLARPMANFLTELSSSKATLILCGPIAFAPVHAFSWEEDGEGVALIERFDLRSTPSATLQSVSAQRAAERSDRAIALTALGNPDLDDPRMDLPAAGAEVEEIARIFADHPCECAYRSEATSSFLEREAPTASHVHLACHGSGSLFSIEEGEEPRIFLADREIADAELVTLGLSADLTVISACETAMSSLSYQPQEAFSLGAAFLGAGSSVAVASLWTVDDLATAILMTRFYSEMVNDGLPPARALRNAQLWLRDLDESAEQEFLAGHPQLDAAFRRREEEGNRPGRRSLVNLSSGAAVGNDRPYASPEFWAPFVCFGAG